MVQPQADEPPAKMTKLAILEEREEDKYEHRTVIKCWACDPQNSLALSTATADPKVRHLSHLRWRAMNKEMTGSISREQCNAIHVVRSSIRS